MLSKQVDLKMSSQVGRGQDTRTGLTHKFTLQTNYNTVLKSPSPSIIFINMIPYKLKVRP